MMVLLQAYSEAIGIYLFIYLFISWTEDGCCGWRLINASISLGCWTPLHMSAHRLMAHSLNFGAYGLRERLLCFRISVSYPTGCLMSGPSRSPVAFTAVQTSRYSPINDLFDTARLGWAGLGWPRLQ